MKVSPKLMTLIPYEPGKPISETKREFGLKDIIKLASNECPFPPGDKVRKAIEEALLEAHRYPDASAFEMRRTAAKYFDLDESWISFGNGSDELIDLLIKIYCEPGDQILTSK